MVEDRYDCSFEKDRKDVNAKSVTLELGPDNNHRERHTAENCRYEKRGLKKCLE